VTKPHALSRIHLKEALTRELRLHALYQEQDWRPGFRIGLTPVIF